MEQNPNILELLKRDIEILRREIEIVHTRYHGSIQTVNERIDAVKATASTLLPELMRRLEELNNAAARRQEQEKLDRQAYVQTMEFRESRNENQTWRSNIEKDLRSFPTVADVRQWVAVLQAKVDGMEASISAITKAMATASGEKQARAWIPAVVTSVLTGLIILILSRLWK